MPRPRRAKGTGSVYRDGDHWTGQLDVGIGPDGKRHRKKVIGRTQREVQQKLAQLSLTVEAGQTVPRGRETVGAFLTRWLETVLRPSVAVTTYASRRMIVQRHLVPTLGRRPLVALTTADIQGYVAEKSKTLAPRTIRLHHATLHAALEVAVDWDLLPKNPVRRIRLPPVSEQDYPVLDRDAAQRFLRLIAQERLAALYVLGLTTGLRIGECLGLQWEAIDLDAGRMKVQRKLLHLGGALLEDAPKGRRVRTAELVPIAVAALKRHQARQAEERLRLGGTWGRPDLVFTSPTGTPLWDSPITSVALPKLAARAGLPRMTFHALRHSFASLLLADGESISVVAEALGHADATVTLRTYRHLLPGERGRATDRLAKLLPVEDSDE